MGIERVEGVDFTPSSFAHFPSQHPFLLYFCAPGAEVMFVRKASRGRPRPGPDTAQRAVSGSTISTLSGMSVMQQYYYCIKLSPAKGRWQQCTTMKIN